MRLLYDVQAKKVEGWMLFHWLHRGGSDGKKDLQKVWDMFLDGTIQPYTGALPCTLIVELNDQSQDLCNLSCLLSKAMV